MLGAIIGDIVGSRWEFDSTNDYNFEWLSKENGFTDDTICTVAVADALLHERDFGESIHDWCNRYPYPMGGYGGRFAQWVHSEQPQPYGSYGNGSAMRVGPVGWAFDTKDDVLAMAKESAECTHNHPEGIKGAQATALAIMMARQGCGKEEIRTEIEKRFEYNLQFTCDEIRPTYTWGGTCQDSVPQAIVAFLDGEDFEDSVRNAISIGGDSDTIGCITGSIAEAYFGVPNELRKQAMKYLPVEFLDIITEFENKYGNK